MRPFPWQALPPVARAHVEAARALQPHLPLYAGQAFAAVARAVGGLTLERRYTAAMTARDARPLLAGTVLSLGSPPSGRWALLALDPKVAPRLARAALGLPLDEAPLPRPPTLAEEGALELLAALLADEQGLAVTGVHDGAGEASRWLRPDDATWLVSEVEVVAAGARGWARLLAPGALRLQPARSRPADDWLKAAARLEGVSVELRVEVGRTALAGADLAGLGAGDVVLFSELSLQSGAPAWLRLGRGGFEAELATPPGSTDRAAGAAAVALRSTFHERGAEMERGGSEEGGAGREALLREIPVELVCELGRVRLSGRELLELQPGTVLPLGRPLAGPVELCAGGKRVARGELVDVEGEVGVRVVALEG